MLRFLFGLTLLLSLPPAAGASLFFILPVRELAFQADAIVVAVPVDRKQVGICKVVRQLKGRQDLTGQEILFMDLISYFPPDGDLPWGQVRQMCLFLTGNGRDYRLLPGGLRCAGRAEAVWRLGLDTGPVTFHLMEQVPSTWDDFLRHLERALPAVKRLLFLKDLPPGSRRNRALLDWIERHRLELVQIESASGQHRSEQGWGSLEMLPFQWVLDSGVLPDCWRAIQLYAEIHSGECLGLDRTIFCSPTGRAFLLHVALGDNQLEGQRRRALRLLASPATLLGKSKALPSLPPAQPSSTQARSASAETGPGAGASGLGAPLDPREQGEILGQMKPLLQARSPALRTVAATAVLAVSRPLSGTEPFQQRLLPALVQAYKAEKPGGARDALAEAVRLVGGEQHWQQLNGQKNGLAAYIQELHPRGDVLFFWLALRSRDLRVHELPALVLERLDKDGKVVEKKTLPLPGTNLVPGLWTAGWDGSAPLYAQLSVAALEMGTWRLTAEGTAGKDKVRWVSEPRLFQVVAVQKPGELQPVNPMVPVKRIAVVQVED